MDQLLEKVFSVDDFTNYASLIADHLLSYQNAGKNNMSPEDKKNIQLTMHFVQLP